ncbi:MAG: CRISPR-associated ring nuclease [Bacillota bacterium]
MSEILICTMGLSPGVVTQMTHYLKAVERRNITTVYVVRTCKDKVKSLFNDIVRTEFEQGDRLQGIKLEDVELQPADTESENQIKIFATEFFDRLCEWTGDNNVQKLHLCFSGGRKSMTYAASLAFNKLVAERPEIKDKLCLWHTVLGEESNYTYNHYEELRELYRNGIPNDSDGKEKRKRLLYPDENSARIEPVPYLEFEVVDGAIKTKIKKIPPVRR